MREIWKNLDINNLDGEIWKNIEGFDGDYEFSNLGRVKSFKRYKEKILYQSKRSKYYCVSLWKNNKAFGLQIHRLVYETFNNYKLKDDEVIHHKDKNRENNNLDNLKLMNKSDHLTLHNKGRIFSKEHKLKISISEKGKIISNETRLKMSQNHCDVKGKKNPMFGIIRLGEKSSNHKLTEKNVIDIWKDLNEGILTLQEIANKFGVSKSTISAIKLGKSWSHIKLENCE